MFISFKEFLENLKTMKFTVAVGMTKLGEVYNINRGNNCYIVIFPNQNTVNS